MDKETAIASPDAFLTFILEKFPEMKDAPCSANHHLNCRGGLMIHTQHVMENAKKYFPDDKLLYFLATVHDIGKVRVYRWDCDKVTYQKPYLDHTYHTIAMLAEINMLLDRDELFSIVTHHGGWSISRTSDMASLAIKLHFCDALAAEIETNGG